MIKIFLPNHTPLSFCSFAARFFGRKDAHVLFGKVLQREFSAKRRTETTKRQGGRIWKENLDHFCLLLRQKNALKTCTRDNKPRGPIRELSSEHTTKKIRGWGLEGFFKHGLPPATTKGCIQSCNATLMKTVENLFQS